MQFLLRPAEVAAILRCSLSAVYSLKDSGKLPYARIGGSIRFRKEDVEQFITESMVIPPLRHEGRARTANLKHLKL